MRDLVFRHATPDDAPAILALLQACRDDLRSRNIGQWVDEYPNLPAILKAIDATFLATLPDSPDFIATACLEILSRNEYPTARLLTPADAKALYIHRLGVHPSHHRQGLGRRLMAFAEAHARRFACTTIRLDTYSENTPALTLYLSLGYTPIGTTHFPFRTKHFIILEKPLTPPT